MTEQFDIPPQPRRAFHANGPLDAPEAAHLHAHPRIIDTEDFDPGASPSKWRNYSKIAVVTALCVAVIVVVLIAVL